MDMSQQAFTQYLRTSESAAARVIRSYSTSFSLASRMLSRRVRTDIDNIYAMVRIADEIVDGAAAGAGLSEDHIREYLDTYERRVNKAIKSGFCADPIVQAFASTARDCDIPTDAIAAFFHSMRIDLDPSLATEVAPSAATDTHLTEWSNRARRDYIYGSAEVVGVMCVCAFIRGENLSPARREFLLARGKRLGAAFQNVNFLRDLHNDRLSLGRDYLGAGEVLDEQRKQAIIAEINEDLAAAGEAIAYLPMSCRAGVLTAHELFAELSRQLAHTPAQQIMHERIRVPDHRKAAIATRSWARARRMSPPQDSDV